MTTFITETEMKFEENHKSAAVKFDEHLTFAANKVNRRVCS